MLNVNQIAPDFTLPEFGGGESHFYDDAKGPSALIFYKFSCGTCRFAFPFLQKIYEAYGDAFYFKAIAEDETEATTKFRQDLGITVPTLLDLSPYSTSAAYGLHTVPSIFLVNPSHEITFASYSFVKQDLLNFADILAEKSGRPQIEIFGEADIPEIKPG
jgi:thiol-disulfide isomerase/thioredoxin